MKLINDAAMQALGDYQGGRMLFLGLGTGLGSAMIVDGVLEPMELAHLPYKKGKTYEDYVGVRGLERLGRKKWQKHVIDVVNRLREALEAEYVVLGGGNAQRVKELPRRLGLRERKRDGRRSPALGAGELQMSPMETEQVANQCEEAFRRAGILRRDGRSRPTKRSFRRCKA